MLSTFYRVAHKASVKQTSCEQSCMKTVAGCDVVEGLLWSMNAFLAPPTRLVCVRAGESSSALTERKGFAGSRGLETQQFLSPGTPLSLRYLPRRAQFHSSFLFSFLFPREAQPNKWIINDSGLFVAIKTSGAYEAGGGTWWGAICDKKKKKKLWEKIVPFSVDLVIKYK